MSNALTYVCQQLAGAGLSVVDWRIAYRSRRDLWRDGLSCSIDFVDRFEAPDGASRWRCVLVGLAPTHLQDGSVIVEPAPRSLVFAFSTLRLAERIEELTGFKPSDLKPAEPEKPVEPEPSAWQRRIAADMKRERERLERLAAIEAPEGSANWQLARWARAELARYSK